MHGTPGVATQRAVVNFAELARRAESPDAPTGFAPASMSGTPPSPAPASSFLALLGEGELKDKPDTQGAVGPNHLMVALNTSVRIQDRHGGVISTVTLSNFWSALGPFNTILFEGQLWDGIGIFDPKLLYDPYANRFIFVTLADERSATSSLLMGVSQTSDPTGNWNLYRFDADASNQTFIDYPFIGFNKDWIAVQAVMFNLNDSFNRVHIYAFNKTNLYAGGNGAFTLFARSDIGVFQTPAATFDTNISTLYLLQQLGEHNRTDLNSLRIFTITGPVGSEVFTVGPTVVSTNRWAFNAPSGFNSTFHPQLGTTRRIYSKGANIYTLSYRNGSLWAAQTVYLPSGGTATRSAVQWWEVRPSGSIIQRGLIDDPSGVNHFDFPSLAVNQFNDVLIGYNRFSSNQYASANYSFRAGDDPTSTLRADAVLKAGEAPVDFAFPNSGYFGGWGDFSATMVDPLNDTDLWTIQEYASTNIGGFGGGDNWGTWWGRIVPPLSLGLTEATVMEGDSGVTNAVFTVTLSQTNSQTITVDFAIVDDTALAGLDYLGTNGALVFNPGETSKLITVPILGDLLDETAETFFVTLNNPTNLALAYTRWTGTILDNDLPPAVSINDINAREGDAGLTDATFTLSLSAPSGLPVSARASTANGAATLRVDYVPTNIVVTIPPGATTQPVTIKLISDTLIESNEAFFVNLSSPTNATLTDSQGICTILDDDFKVTAVELAGSDVRLHFTTQTNQTYRVERTESLAAPVIWEPVPGAANVPGNGATVAVLDAGATGQPQRFYRVRLN
jgi:hypothetical protein